MIYRFMYCAVTVVLFISLATCLQQRAYAYVDPGTSLLLFQSIGAMFTGAVYFFRRRLKALFTRLGGKKKVAAIEPSSEESR